MIEQVYGLQSLLYGIYDFFDGERFLIQQAIELIRYEDRLTDLRAELQRNGNGDLEIVGISARLGKSNSPITTHGDAHVLVLLTTATRNGVYCTIFFALVLYRFLLQKTQDNYLQLKLYSPSILKLHPLKTGISRTEGDIKQMQGLKTIAYRLRVGKYRVIYEYTGDENEILFIKDIGSRGDIYK